jgi:hypothetical protein
MVEVRKAKDMRNDGTRMREVCGLGECWSLYRIHVIIIDAGT